MNVTPVPAMRIDDLNWGRLNLISAVDQVGDQRSWNVEFEHGGRRVKVSCRALPELCVPHGVDNDVSSALIDLLDSSGLPEDGLVTVSGSELMALAGFHRNGRYWAMLRESLDRLHTTSFEVSGGWRDHPNRRWITAKFHFIENLEYTHQGEAGNFDERTMIQLQLAKPLVMSMLSGYTKPLNMTFMHSLSRPRTRILFRLLDAMRYDPENPECVVDTLDVGLVEWADQCKISSARPDSVRRALESPHDELIKRGYLRTVTIHGRGRQQRLSYEFTPDFAPVNPALLARLRRHGVADGVSRGLARTYSLATLTARLDQFEALLRSGKLTPRKSAAAALVHLIKNNDQYDVAPTVKVARPSTRGAVKPDEELAVTVTELVGTLQPEERGRYLVRQLSLLLRGKLTTLELDALQSRAVAGELDVAEVCAAVLKAKTTNQVPSLLASLRESLHQPELF